jgi:metal-responsive CopG/Arc/MetJ family transcriptional regulator
MATRTKAKRHAGGRPSSGIDEVRVVVPMPALLSEVAAAKAAEAGVSRTEWIRRAMRAALDWREEV